MRILINTNGVSVGGGLQLVDSIIREMIKHNENDYIIVHHGQLPQTTEDANKNNNVELFFYETPKWPIGCITGRNKVLDQLVAKKNIDVVFTVMGPSKWKPRVPHLEGFARCLAVIPESPYWNEMNKMTLFKMKMINVLLKYLFRASSDVFWAESEFISDRIRQFLPSKAKVYTVSGYYNQVYDKPEEWDNSINFPPFDGITLLMIAANYPHKNHKVLTPLVHYMARVHPNINFRVVVTINENDLPGIDDLVKKHLVFIGGVKINQCPHMYEQSDIMFLPSLIECFSACYPEAMRMKKPILVPDLGFATVTCKNAAQYFNPNSIESLGEALYDLCTDANLRGRLVENGTEQLKEFNNYEQRANKLLGILESLV